MRTTEAALEPHLPIIDAHHHLWDSAPANTPFPPFPIGALISERAASGHDIRATVFVDCRWSYLADGPDELRPIGETRAVEAVANAAETAGQPGLAAGIVSHADMALGDQVEPVLRAHMAQSPSRFRGVRQVTPWHPGVKFFGSEGEKEKLRRPEFRASVACLGRLGLSFDAFVLFPQLSDVADLARHAPETTIILNHVGSPRSIPGVPAEEADQAWRKGLVEVATCPNVVLKLGGLLMHDRGADVSGSEDAAAAMRHHLLTAIDLFTPDRCLFESNFPVDGVAIPYGHLWNAFKRVTADFTPQERQALFWRTAARVYKLEI